MPQTRRPQTRRDLLISTTALGVGLAAPLAARSAPTPAFALQVLFDETAQDLLQTLPETATLMGLDRGKYAETKFRLNDRSERERHRFTSVSARRLERLQAIDRRTATGRSKAVYDTLSYWFAENAAQARFPYWDQMAGQISPYVLSQITGAYQSVPDFMDSQHVVESKDDADAYIARLHAFAACLDQETDRFRQAAALGVIPPDYLMDKTLKQIAELRATAPAASTLATSIARRTKEHAIPGDYAAQAARILETQIAPALDRQIDALKAAQPHAGHQPSVFRLPDGEAFYAEALRQNITTDLTAAQIHQMGEDMAKTLSAELDAALRVQGLTEGGVGPRLRALYDDPKYRYPNTEAGKDKLLADLHGQVDRVRAKLPQVFATLPKAEMVIRRVPPYLESGAPGAYAWPPGVGGSRPGSYYINLRDTSEVPSWTLPTLTHHEGIPGHYLQGALENESTELPLVQQILGVDYNLPSFNAYLEGWALYAEQLADEIGMYASDPLGRIGYLHDALFRAGRMVADTGLHAMGWTRERATQYFVELMGDPVSSAQGEIDRYCVWPGQACSYMVGKITWLRLRGRAQKELGARYDIRDFHDAGLLAGAMPLAVLETAIEAYIKAKRA